MAVYSGPEIVNNGLVLHLDAANSRSYPGSGASWNDMSGAGNNITLLNSPTYSSTNNGVIVFDGVDDYSNPPISHSYLSSSTMEVIFRPSALSKTKQMIFGYRHNGGYSNPTIGSLYIENTNRLMASVITNTQAYRIATSSVILQANTTYHAMLYKDVVNGVLKIYVNGVETASQTFDAATYGYWAGSYVGANILDIAKSTNNTTGQGWGSDHFTGFIGVMRVYNRLLTAAEIQQNFEATRGRYGI